MEGIKTFPATIPPQGARSMTFSALMLQPIVALIAGILILVTPSLLSYIVAIYLIIVGISGLLPHIAQ